jgi:hypothetical protein
MTSKRFIVKNGLDNNSQTIINVSDPVNAQDAATKNFSSNANNITSGILAIAYGGTGVSAFTANGALYVTSTGTLTSGVLPVLSGGTGANTAAGALNALIPSQTGNSGKFLTTDGANVSWITAVAGANTQVQYNNAGAFGGDAGFTFTGTGTSGNLTVGNVTGVTSAIGTISPNFFLVAGAAASTQSGGPTRLWGAAATGSGKAGGSLSLQGGESTLGTGGSLTLASGSGVSGGPVNITSGHGTSAGSSGNLTITTASGGTVGTLTIAGGQPTGSAAGGNLVFTGGASVSSAVGGNLTFNGGLSASGNGGALTLTGGISNNYGATPAFVNFQGGLSTGAGSNINFQAGDAGFGSGANPGNITITTGLIDGGIGGTSGGYFAVVNQNNPSTPFKVSVDATGTTDQIGFFGATPVTKPAPTASGTGNVLTAIAAGLNSLGLVSSSLLTNITSADTIAQAGYNQANSAYAQANTATSIAQSAFNKANTSITIGTTSIGLGNTSLTLAGLTSVTSNTFVGALTGNATTATTLATSRNINGVAFNGSADITVTAAAGTLTGTTLNATVVNSSLTSVGTVTSGTWSGSFGSVSGANLTNITAANIVGTLPSAVLGNTTIYVGTTAIALNRASANLGLTGITSIAMPGATSGTITVTPAATAGATAITIPATTGTLVTTGDSGTVTNTMLAGSIANAKLANSAVTVGTTAISLGSSSTTLAGLTSVSSTGFTGALTGAASSNVLKAGDTMTGELILFGDPVNALGAATKQYVDNGIAGLSWKTSVAAATTANITLSGLQTIDGYTTIAGDRILVKNQSTTTANGIYLASATAWTRTTDADTPTELNAAAVYVQRGTTLADTGWVQTTIIVTVGTTAVTWAQFTGAGSYVAGTGLSLVGNTFSNSGVLSVTGTTNQITTSASTGAITLSLPQNINSGAAPTFAGTNFTGIPNGALSNSAITIGTTAISLGSANTTLAGLTSVTSTTFVGALTGNASTATALATSRTLWGQGFTGAANVTGSLTAVGDITGTAGVTLTATAGTLALAATGVNSITASTNGAVKFTIDSAGNITPGITNTQTLGAAGDVWSTVYATTFTGALTGNADTATKWATARTLAGNSVDGSANVAFSNKFVVQGTTDAGLSGAQFLGALGTGIVKNTTTTGVLSIAVAADFPTLNQNTTGSAATLTTSRNINGVAFNGSADITVTAAASTLTGTTLNATVVNSSLTSVGTITSGTWSGLFGAVSGANLTNITAGNLSGTIPGAVLGNSTTYVGTTAVALNRASANLGLTGITSLAMPGATSGTITLTPAATAGTTAITIPATAGTLITTGDTGTVTNTMLAGSIANAKLANSAVTVGTTAISLGSSSTTLAGLTSVSSTSFTGALTGAASSNVLKAGDTMTGELILSGDPTNTLGAATKQYVDNGIAGLSWKTSVLAATTANITLSGLQTIDGYTTLANDRVLVKNQTTTSTNGIYLASAGAWTRATDADTAAELNGAAVYVQNGTTLADTGWVQTTTVVTIGTTAVTWAQFSGSGAYVAGTGLSLVGNTFSNSGVLSITGTANQVTASASTGAITLSLPQSINSGAAPTFAGTNFTGIPNGALTNSAVTIGTTAISLGASSTTLVGLTSVSSTGFTGALTGNADTATKWATARTLAGNSVDGSANVAFSNKFVVQGTADTGLSGAQFLGALGTGIVKNTTTTGVLSIAIAADFPTLNQSTTGSAATLTTPRAIYGNNFDGSAALTGIIASTYGGTGNGFTKFTGPTTAEKTFTLPDASATLLYSGGALGTPSSGTLTNCTFPTLNQNTTGYATSLAGGNATTLLGSVPYQSALNTTTLLAPNTTTTKKFFTQTGDGTNGAAPVWNAIAAVDVPTLNQNTTGSAATLTTSRTLWGQGFTGAANVTGSLTAVGDITGTAGVTLTATAGTLALAATGVNSITASTNGATRLTIDSSGNITSGVTNTQTFGTAGNVWNNIYATTFTGALTGNATTATTLATSRNINGVAFNGSADITVTAAAGTLTGTTLNATVVSSSLTSVGTVTTGTWSGSFGAVSGANLTGITAGNLSGTIPSAVLANSTHYIGTTAVTLNRASANLGLTGITSLAMPGATSGTITLTPAATAGTTAITVPATAGTLVTTGDTGTVTNTMLAGSISNANLANSSVTVNGTAISLGSSGTVTAAAGTLTGTTLNATVVNSSLTSVGTLSSLAVTGTTTQTGAFNLAGAASPLQVQGSAGTSGQVLTSAGAGATPTWGAAGSGTVTSVSVVTANGVSGTVATATTTPAITLTLGAITPSSVTATGVVTGSAFVPSGSSVPSNGMYLSAANTLNWSTATTLAMTLSSAGALTVVNDITAFSDSRLKNNIETITNALNKVEAVRGVTYTRTDSDDKQKRHTGVIAQEIEAVLPEAVHINADGIRSVAYGNMMGLLIEAVKELSSQNKALLARLEVLEAKE